MYGPGSRGLFRPKSDFMSISLLVLGISSFLFHASLQQVFQFADELSMLGLAWAILQGVLIVRGSSSHARLINTSLAIIFPLFSAFYVWTGKIIYHATVFIAIVVLITVRGCYLVFWLEPRFPKAKLDDWRARGAKALAVLVLGYVLWNIDLEMCEQLRALRAQVGLPWAWLLEFHGWWHVFTAISAAQTMDMVRDLQEQLRREKEE